MPRQITTELPETTNEEPGRNKTDSPMTKPLFRGRDKEGDNFIWKGGEQTCDYIM